MGRKLTFLLMDPQGGYEYKRWSRAHFASVVAEVDTKADDGAPMEVGMVLRFFDIDPPSKIWVYQGKAGDDAVFVLMNDEGTEPA